MSAGKLVQNRSAFLVPKLLSLFCLVLLSNIHSLIFCQFASCTEAIAKALIHARSVRIEQKNEEALRLYDEIVARYPKRIEGYLERSDLLKEMGFMDRALADANSILAFAPGNIAALRVRAHLYDMTGKLPQAIRDYTTLIAANKSDSGNWRARGIAYKRLKRYQEAASDLGAAALAEPQNKYYAEILYDQADMLLLSGDYAKSVQVFSQLAKIAPDVSTAFWGRAKAYDKLGKADLAARDREQAKKLDYSMERF